MAGNIMSTAVSGLNTFNEALSIVSDNIANAATTGWKSNTVDFGDLVGGLIATSNNNITAQGVGSSVLGVTSDFGVGSETQTGLWSDLMIQGNGFFEVQDSNGADYYTRDGSFQITTGGTQAAPTAYLTDGHGNYVLDPSGNKISMLDPSDATTTLTDYAIDKYGNVTGTDPKGNIIKLGVVDVSTVPNPNGLIRVGENMYTWGTSAGTVTPQAPGTGQAGTLVSSALEGSNVDLTQQMVNLINYQADYQANSKSVTTGDTLLQTVVNMVR